MNYEKLLSDFNGFRGQDFGTNPVAYQGVNPFQNVQGLSKFATPYQFPATGGLNPFMHIDGSSPLVNSQGYGLKFGNEQSYGPSAVETQQSHYGPPMMQSKGGKLKGAALSALTLLAFLFFLNLLQSCLKDQMDAMHPTVMVMSAGQRNMFLNRDAGDDLKKANENLEAAGFEDDENIEDDYETDESTTNDFSYPPQLFDKSEQTMSSISSTKKRKVKNQRRKIKSNKQQQLSLIESKLNNLRQGMIVKSHSDLIESK